MPSTTKPRCATDEYAMMPFQVRLHRGDDRAVGDADHREHEQDRREVDRGLREHRDREAQEPVGAHLQQHAGQHDRARGRRVGVRVGQPRVEREQRHLHREADREREEQPLRGRRSTARRVDDAQAVSVAHVEREVAGRVLVQERDRRGCPTNRNAEPAIVNRKNFIAA